MKYEGYVLFADYDNTLTCKEKGFHEENREAIRYFMQEGGLFGLGSGRNLKKYRTLGVEANAPLILRNGSQLYDIVNEKYIEQFRLDPSVTDLYRRIYEEIPEAGLLLHMENSTYCYRTYETEPGRLSVSIPEDISLIGTHADEAIMGSILGDPETMEKAAEILKDYPKLEGVRPDTFIIDVISPGISKGSGLRYLKEHGYLNGKTIIAAGDGDNDVPLLKEADLSFVVNNAKDSVKEYADVILKDSSVPCMPQILEYLDREEESDGSR